jgi:hypothetical protein
MNHAASNNHAIEPVLTHTLSYDRKLHRQVVRTVRKDFLPP